MHSFRSLLDGLPPHSRALEAREVRTRPTSLSLAACPSFAWSPPLDPTLMEALAATYQVSQVYHYQSLCSVRKLLREFHCQAIEGRFLVVDGHRPHATAILLMERRDHLVDRFIGGKNPMIAHHFPQGHIDRRGWHWSCRSRMPDVLWESK